MFKRSKKGISPLIATVLLIAFAVALGAVVMNVSAGLIEEQTKEPAIDCAKLAIDVFKVRERPQVCFSDGQVTYRLTNTGIHEVSDVRVQVIGERGVAQSMLGEAMSPADIKDSAIAYSLAKNGNIVSARFIPLSGEMVCQAQGVEIADVRDC